MSTRLNSVAPILPVRELEPALAHYAALGFRTNPYGHGTTYGYAVRDGVDLHLVGIGDHHDPKSTASSVYLYVDDADALFAEWSAAGVPGRLVAPRDTEYGLREGAHADPDGNLLRFGSPLTSHDTDAGAASA